MLKIYYNEKSDADMAVHLTVQGSYIKAEITDKSNGAAGTDILENMLPYNSYALVRRSGEVKNYRKMNASDFKWLDLNRLGVATKLDFAQLTYLYSDGDIIQADTGILADEEKDIIIRIFVCDPEQITIDADQEYTMEPFNSDDLVLGSHPRMTLWDSYSLSANGHEFKANRKGFPVDGDFEEELHCEEGKDYIDFTITKYKGDFSSGEKLERDIDDEDVLVDASAGVLNCRRVWLENGVGHFRLYPMGYEGLVKIKLGRKWYEVWNDYLLTIGGEE